MTQGRLIFLTEEESMNLALRELLPRIRPAAHEFQHWLAIAHQGKADLDRSFPRKLRAWQEPNARFCILRDNDGADCATLKQELLARIPGNAPATTIRLVCQELESWFLGDLDAVCAAFPSASRRASFRSIQSRDPDTLTNASELLKELTGTAAKRIRSQQIARHLDPARNRSKSFEVFVRTLQRWHHPA